MSDSKVFKADANVYFGCGLNFQAVQDVVAEANIATVVNLVPAAEDGYEDHSSLQGVKYRHVPYTLNVGDASAHVAMDKVLVALDVLPKPILVCDNVGQRSELVALCFHCSRHRMILQDYFEQGPDPGFLSEEARKFGEEYTAKKVENSRNFPALNRVCDPIMTGTQVTEELLQQLAAQNVKGILNIRGPEEMGAIGLGIFPRERALVEGLGMTYVNVATPTKSVVEEPYLSLVLQAMETMPRPFLLHCRSGIRAKYVLAAWYREHPPAPEMWPLAVSNDVFIGKVRTPANATDVKMAVIGHKLKSVVALDEASAALSSGVQGTSAQFIVASCQISVDDFNHDIVRKVLVALDTAPRPLLLLSETGLHSALIALMHVATRTRVSVADVLEHATDPAAFSILSGNPALACAEEYISNIQSVKHSFLIQKDVEDDVLIGAQMTEERLRELAGQGVKAVLNMRGPEEMGSVGLGVFAREREIVEALGMVYAYVSTPAKTEVEEPYLTDVINKLGNLPRPLLLHCRSGKRASYVYEMWKKRAQGCTDK